MKTRDASYAFTGVQLGDTIAAKASEYSASCETTKRNGYIQRSNLVGSDLETQFYVLMAGFRGLRDL